ncbi:ATP-binding protein [Cellulomonas palmilytica]|uniref:ATP-binding protein n=1 Tax=Cellulomonas palmilytica TaxID=2608402 RepID=UPI001F26DB5D|nr:ATP-binding protein [Cellulomonas palmilytica]UJP40314.1 ATP-binding protein [Cellulomonas palmilytica]
MTGFVGRSRELADLHAQLTVVESGTRDARGVAILLRGRRRVGKSRLAEELVAREGVPHVTFQAARHAPVQEELDAFARAIATSDLPDAAIAAETSPTTLTAALTLLAAALPDDRRSVVVLDEVPWLLEAFPGGAGELQRTWDQALSRKPVLLLLLGSDLAMMEHLAQADQPFHGRATEMVLHALSPRDVARMTGLTGVDAFDAHLITGGQPLIAQEWQPQEPPSQFLARSFGTSLSALVASGTRVLDSEFPEGDLTRRVLTTIGDGERTFTKIQHATGLQPTSLHRVLKTLLAKRVVAVDSPLSTARSRETRYRVADPALRFWLPFVEPALHEVDRARPDLAVARVERSYSAWRGRAVEPLVRDAVSRLLLDTEWAHVTDVGSWWPRTNSPELDLVGARGRPADEIALVGTVKWRTTRPVDRGDVATLTAGALAVPGVDATTPLVAVCPAGAEAGLGLAAVWDADDLLTAWP